MSVSLTIGFCGICDSDRILAHHSERALFAKAWPETAGGAMEDGVNALLGVRAGAMDAGRDTLHLVFTVKLHFL
jgi:hypothetical protein